MVKTEISYNPYLLKTEIRLNGEIPKINSLVEKYYDKKLQTWISKVPEILFNEMNGYDFDLDFSGTKNDFEQLAHAFRTAGISIKDVEKANGEILSAKVRLFFKNELEDSITKSNEIDSLLKWLEETPNRKFNVEDFRSRNSELFTEPYTYLLVQASNLDKSIFNDFDISIENVNTINELPNDLTNTPILFYVDEENQADFFDLFVKISAREDVIPEQLFFLVSSQLKSSKIEREIYDRGLKKPQLVHSASDNKIRYFLEVYSITDYVSRTIAAFRNSIFDIDSELKMEKETELVQNNEIHKKLDQLDVELEKLKRAYEQYKQKDNLEISTIFTRSKIELYEKIQSWQKKKTKYTNDDSAKIAANQFESDLKIYFLDFLEVTKKSVYLKMAEIQKNAELIYMNSEASDNFSSNISSLTFDDLSSYGEVYGMKGMEAELLAFREVKLVEPKDVLSGFARKFIGDKTQPQVLVEDITYSISQWRDRASQVLTPLVNGVIDSVSDSLKTNYEVIFNNYQSHLEELIAEKTAIKEEATTNLSDEEKKIQDDSNWLSLFEEKLGLIERG